MTRLNKVTIFRHWLPLASTWIMMALEGPYLAAVVARMEDPKLNLAAFGIVFAIGLLMESPIIMMMAAATRLVKDHQSYLQLRRFNLSLSVACTVCMMGLLIPPIFNFWVYGLLELDPKLGALVYSAMICLLPWPGMIGYRRFYQGILIKAKHSRRIALGTVLRLLAMSLCAYFGYRHQGLGGASVACLSLSAGVTAEALFVGLASRPRIRTLRSQVSVRSQEKLSILNIWHFYYPLALTALIGLTVQPLITFCMGKAQFPIESLAVLPVVNSLVFFFRAIPLSFQEVVISLLDDHEGHRKALGNFALGLGTLLTVIIVILAFTPLSHLWFSQVAGLPDNLASLAGTPLALASFVPGLSLTLCWQRSLLIHFKTTKPVTYASAIELLLVGLCLGIGIGMNAPYPGVTLAMLSMVLGRAGSTIYLKYYHGV